MKKKAVGIFYAAIILFAGGCVSFKIEPLPEPEQLVETFALCKRVLPDGELLAPVDITTDFVLEDPGVFCFVELKNVGESMTLQWKWYSPDGKLFKETDAVPVNTSQVYLETVTAYDRLDIPREESLKGGWVVVIVVSGRLAGRRTFNIR
ncbi:MAG: hypothetical protein PVI66_02710 [Candidatus Aminicenantes bacterium]|jgi:hypothetical protein